MLQKDPDKRPTIEEVFNALKASTVSDGDTPTHGPTIRGTLMAAGTKCELAKPTLRGHGLDIAKKL